VEGETLAKRLEKGPLPVDQVLKYGMQIADALDKAHRSGVVHRDLKPGNIMLTPTGAKLLDFGLAKPAAAIASLVTMTATAAKPSPATEEGTIVGTFQYMSPEQIEGKGLDGRSDIFSLGAVLYEMMTGQHAFPGKSQLSVASAILEKEPTPISTVKPMTPPALDHAIRRCLAKDPEERWQTARDHALELKWIGQSDSQAAGQPHRIGRAWHRTGWLLSTLLLLLIVAAVATWWARSRQYPQAMYFNSAIPFAANDVALSPNGKFLATVAYSDQANKYVIWVHQVGSRSAAVVPGTEGASHPFWSPDSRFMAFFAGGKLKKIDASGKLLQILCDAPNGRGGTWNKDGVILFSPDVFAGLFRVPAGGGTPTEVTKLDLSRPESSHRWPNFLPDGRHFLYLAANFAGQFDKNAIFVGSLNSTEKHFVVSASSNAAYADPGYLLYLGDNNALVAQRFDSRAYALTGDPLTVGLEVQYLSQVDLALFDVVGKGILAAQTGKGADRSQFTWFDRSGKPAGTIGPPGSFGNPTVSPDGRRLAFDQTEADGRRVGVWIRELATDAVTRFTLDPSLNQTPVWSPDGKRVVFSSNRKLFNRLYLKNADGSGPEQQIADLGATQEICWDWSRDGQYLLVRRDNELWSLSLPDFKAKPFVQARWTVRNAQFSPDGRWVAYATNETGTWEVFVSPFPNANSKWQVSRSGGEQPKWRRDGKELFYLSGEGKMMSVSVKAGSNFEVGTPVALFQTHT